MRGLMPVYQQSDGPKPSLILHGRPTRYSALNIEMETGPIGDPDSPDWEPAPFILRLSAVATDGTIIAERFGPGDVGFEVRTGKRMRIHAPRHHHWWPRHAPEYESD